MSSTLEYTFEELPLLTVGGFAAGLVSGKANIKFHADGEWFVKEIYLDGYRPRAGGGHDKQAVEVEMDGGRNDLYQTIWGELTDGSFKESVGDAVQVALEEEGAIPHSAFNENSTLHRAFQGV